MLRVVVHLLVFVRATVADHWIKSVERAKVRDDGPGCERVDRWSGFTAA